MAGIIVPILNKQAFEYSFLAATTSKAVVIQKALNAIPFRSGRLLVRVHDIVVAGSQQFEVRVFGTDPSDSDPLEFTVASPIMSVTVNSTVSSGSLLSDTDSDLYPFLKVGVIATQGATTGAALYTELSIDLLLREY